MKNFREFFFRPIQTQAARLQRLWRTNVHSNEKKSWVAGTGAAPPAAAGGHIMPMPTPSLHGNGMDAWTGGIRYRTACPAPPA